ncbi:aminoglycoside phosphotransferase family protein [Paenibacillus sp. ACRRX]|uniref:aminoglycoside phosphotransferase family protein n=1 Tax=Paenibacillus sp. ACRRX TaxID=2918206 RepID=UPI001EF609C1|nr:aminoglycoside phosphotransferase family protein [Paenibacillus sp. ACRRX]MCG7407336.1 aminoglycoside phosphotransferase family protein [Paenibacillus sp. ACRRX]
MSVQNARVAQGRTAEILGYGECYVLKWFRPHIPRSFAEEEFRISQLVYQMGVSGPKPIELLEYEQRIGIVYERLAGRTMLSLIGSRPWNIRSEGKRLARLHTAIHAASIQELPQQHRVLAERIEQAPSLTHAEKKRVMDQLLSLPEGRQLCHGDFHPDNVMIDRKQEWVLDWMTGMSGNPAGDAARTILLLEMGAVPEGTSRWLQSLLSYIRRQLVYHYKKSYVQLTGMQLKEIEDWMIPVAAARLVEGVPEVEKSQLTTYIRKQLHIMSI